MGEEAQRPMIDFTGYDTSPRTWLHIVKAFEPAASFDVYPYIIKELIDGSGIGDEDLAETLPDADPSDLKAIGIWPSPDLSFGVTPLLVSETAAQLVARLQAAYPGAPTSLLAIRILYNAIVWAEQQPTGHDPTKPPQPKSGRFAELVRQRLMSDRH
jgi:hypothetical protein